MHHGVFCRENKLIPTTCDYTPDPENCRILSVQVSIHAKSPLELEAVIRVILAGLRVGLLGSFYYSVS